MNIIGHIYIKKPIYKIEWKKMSLIVLKNGCNAMNLRAKMCQTKVPQEQYNHIIVDSLESLNSRVLSDSTRWVN